MSRVEMVYEWYTVATCQKCKATWLLRDGRSRTLSPEAVCPNCGGFGCLLINVVKKLVRSIYDTDPESSGALTVRAPEEKELLRTAPGTPPYEGRGTAEAPPEANPSTTAAPGFPGDGEGA